MKDIDKKKILIILGAYLPGYKVGGPGVSVANLVEALGDEYDFRIMCADHDLGEKEPYKDINTYTWTSVGKALVCYVPKFTTKETVARCREADVVYLCGCFNDYARQVLRAKSKRKFNAPVIIASMGLFDPGAYRILGLKKRVYMALTGFLGFYDDVSWSATTVEEAGHIAFALHCEPDELSYYVANDLPRIPDDTDYDPHKKNRGTLSVVFLSRISEKKNLLGTVKMLKLASRECKIRFDIYGPVEDEAYFEKCRKALDEAGSDLTWKYNGPVTGVRVYKAFSESDVFLFPTMGENFGHVINESLCAGCPVITSDRTPWNDLKENGAGFSLSLPDSLTEASVKNIESDDNGHSPKNMGSGEDGLLNAWLKALKYYADMSDEEYRTARENCIRYIRSKYDIEKMKSAYRDMFEEV